MIYPVLSESFDSNCYIVVGEKTAVIDSGINPGPVLQRIDELGVGVDFLINTHCHFDHVGGNKRILERTKARLCVHELGVEFLEKGDKERLLAHWFSAEAPKMKVDVRLVDGQRMDLGKTTLEIMHTPGHTIEGICLYEPESKSLFSGDTVFADGIGRVDLSGGSMSELEKSLLRILDLHRREGIDVLYPGHGSIGSGDDIEKAYNMFFG
ncbi:MAG: MBL fold metallo-hydrolase [Candidatus Altiarchaeota archaeon]|nr:MBL fold metallo-hydrolase [Candidatus Altiarchaeota archaeon]